MAYQLDMDEFPAILREFASYKTAIQNCSPKTASEYLLDLRTFFRFLLAKELKINPDSDEFCEIDIRGVDIDYIKGITADRIYDFLLYTGDVRKNMWSAKARKLSAIKGLFKYMTVKRGYLEEDIAANIEAPKRKKTLPKVLSLSEARLLLDAVRNDVKSKSRLRDLCMITLFLNCGLRISELCGLNISDIQDDALRVLGKGNKVRVVYLNEACKAAIAEYLAQRRPIVGRDKNALFLSSRDERISRSTVHALVKKHLSMAGIDSTQYSPHKLRHTAATLMLQNGVDVKAVQEVLGHDHLNTTEIYTHIDNESLRIAAKANPLSRVKPPKKTKDEE